MNDEEIAAKRSLIERWFPVRYLYLRDGDDVRACALSPRRQCLIAVAAVAFASWTLVASGGLIFDFISNSQADRAVVRARAASERVNADLQARLDSAVIRMTTTTGSIDDMATMVERRHAALTNVMGMFRGVDGAELALRPALPATTTGRSPVQRILAVRLDQERLIARAEEVSQTRAERLRLAFRLAGLNPSAYAATGPGLGGPLVEARDPRALAAVLDVDEAFAVRIRHAADNLNDMRRLADAAEGLPFPAPDARAHHLRLRRALRSVQRSTGPASGPGLRGPAEHAHPCHGPRRRLFCRCPGSGYGNTVEIDHGRGLKTRFAHLNSMAVTSGQQIALGQRIGAMGTTGRSTGVHLHYEVWMNGRPQNPARFMKAGDQLVQQE